MENFTSLYFIGAGGIGMSALVRYFLAKGYHVAGYDRTPSDLTEALINEGMMKAPHSSPNTVAIPKQHWSYIPLLYQRATTDFLIFKKTDSLL